MNLYRLTKFQAENRILQHQLSMVYKLQLSIYDSYIFKKENTKAVNVSGKYFTMISFGYWIDFHDKILLIWKYFRLLRKNQLAWWSFHGLVFIFNSIISPYFSQLFFSSVFLIWNVTEYSKIFISLAKFSYCLKIHFLWIG